MRHTVDRLFTLAMIILGSALVGAGTGSTLLGFGACFLTLAAYNAPNLRDDSRYPKNPRTGDEP